MRRASTTLNIAVVAPMPSASVAMAVSVKVGRWRRLRSAARISRRETPTVPRHRERRATIVSEWDQPLDTHETTAVALLSPVPNPSPWLDVDLTAPIVELLRLLLHALGGLDSKLL